MLTTCSSPVKTEGIRPVVLLPGLCCRPTPRDQRSSQAARHRAVQATSSARRASPSRPLAPLRRGRAVRGPSTTYAALLDRSVPMAVDGQTPPSTTARPMAKTVSVTRQKRRRGRGRRRSDRQCPALRNGDGLATRGCEPTGRVTVGADEDASLPRPAR